MNSIQWFFYAYVNLYTAETVKPQIEEGLTQQMIDVNFGNPKPYKVSEYET